MAAAKKTEKTCFIIMPITTPPLMVEKYADGKEHFRHVLSALFTPAIKSAGLTPIPPLAEADENIPARIIQRLNSADLVLCDMSALNANVFFELGIRTALNKPVALVKDEASKPPFDAQMINYHEYESTLHGWEIQDQISKLAKHIDSCAESTENSIWKYFGLHAYASPPTQSSSEDQIAYLVRSIAALRADFREFMRIDDDGRRETPPIPTGRIGWLLERLATSDIDVYQVSVDETNGVVEVEYTSDSDEDVTIRELAKSVLPYGVTVRPLRIPSKDS